MYSLVREEDTVVSGCQDNCVYKKKNCPGQEFCFRPGSFLVQCREGQCPGSGGQESGGQESGEDYTDYDYNNQESELPPGTKIYHIYENREIFGSLE